ncbi:upstream-binding 1 isoform X1 [Brachionus plicatilis]|uniref:Upstream-binding 1 isoform X1 n=1 Tax=Brachionus plicatilis TaxID=10195 RepID=A0A3M7QJ33_BRAPC|nr:upstream-binding 1 isoform X1 [Brachionus plicatilis]
MRMLEIDSNSSYGIVEVRMSDAYTNAAEILWNGRTGANIFFRCNCTSTAFAPHKHGGEKGIHMRFQIDTYETVAHTSAKLTYSNETLAFTSSHSSLGSSSASILSPPNSTSSPNSIKFIKDDLDSNRSMGTPTPTAPPPPPTSNTSGKQWLEFAEAKHLSGSYCRIQLFRLKGAQRKLKTDRSKIDRLNPPDLRKRYQPSTKITLLNNCSYDWLYSLLPFVKQPSEPAPHTDPNTYSHYAPNTDFPINSNTSTTFSHPTNTVPFPQNPAYPSTNPNASIDFMHNMNQSQYVSHYSSLDMPSAPNEGHNALYLDNCYQHINQHMNQHSGATNSTQSNDYGYSRVKRTSSFSSNYQNFAKPSKMQKTGAVGSPQLYPSTYNTMSSVASSSSSASSSSCTSSPTSPTSPMIHLQPQQSQLESSPLPYDCSNKYVQEWLVQNRFFNLLGVFSNYTSNDVLRLSKEDMVSLCGGADGIRCYNMAHNVQIKPKLTVYVAFGDQSFFWAIFLSDSNSSSLLAKVLSVFAAFVRGSKSAEEKVEGDDEVKSRASVAQLVGLHEKILSGSFEYELFLKVKGALVKATDEVLNNFDDQSKFFIDFDILDQQADLAKTCSLPSKLNSLASNLPKTRPPLLRVMLVPLD